MAKLKIGVFGGTFDPVHTGHLILADQVRDQEGLDKVLLAPTAVPPHKDKEEQIDIAHRLEMVRLALAGQPELELCRFEADPGKVSYSIETLDRLREEFPPGAEIRFILGADQLDAIETWKEYDRLLKEYGLYVAGRPGAGQEEVFRRYENYVRVVQMPLIEISATDIRRRVRDGRSIRFLVPGPVEDYIYRNKIYTAS
jgi:nicotinate-nucleotide adenylyltransferase